MGRLRRLRRVLVGRRPGLVSLRTTFVVSFAAVTAAVTIVVGILSYNAAARLVRVDEQSVFTQVVSDVQDEVKQDRMVPEDFFSSSRPGHDLVRPVRPEQGARPERRGFSGIRRRSSILHHPKIAGIECKS